MQLTTVSSANIARTLPNAARTEVTFCGGQRPDRVAKHPVPRTVSRLLRLLVLERSQCEPVGRSVDSSSTYRSGGSWRAAVARAVTARNTTACLESLGQR